MTCIVPLYFYKNKCVYLCILSEAKGENSMLLPSIMIRDAGMPGFCHADHVTFLSVSNQASDTQGTTGDGIVY